MLPLSDFLTVWAFLAVNVAAPGPNVVNTITTAMQGGRGAGLASAAGVGTGVAGWCLGMSLGMSALFALWPGLQAAFTVAALGLLLWFAWRFLAAAVRGFRQGGTVGGAALRAGGGTDRRSAFLRSLAVIAVNPKALTSWLTVLAMFPVAKAGPADIALLCAGTIVLASGIHTAYAILFSTGPALRLYQRWGWVLSGVAGVFFLTVAVFLARRLAGMA